MTSGDLRTEPTLMCVLNGYTGTPILGCSGQPLFGTFDQVTTPAQESTANLPTSQQRAVLNGMSGLLQMPPPPPPPPGPGTIGGLIAPIPYETTTARLETGD